VDRTQLPRPDRLRQIEGGFGAIDHRIRFFWDDLSREELLLYFFLCTTSNEQGCSWYSTRKICKILKIGPATLIRARQTLEQRRLIATQKDDLSQRTIYQVLPLPIDKNVTIEIPIKPKIDIKKKTKSGQNAEVGNPEPSTDQHSLNLSNIEKLQQLLNMNKEN
jgi:hypothetical protein